MDMKRHIFAALAAAVLLASPISGQNLNPTVDVTRDYEVKMMEIRKPLQTMHIPDSVLKFNIDVDYSVFDNPYRGSYDFSPYLINVRPDARKADDGRFYLRFGAGYPLHPEGDIVFSPRMKGPFRLGIYGHHRSYIGKYHDIVYDAGKYAKSGEWWNGRDMATKAGVDGLYAWTGGLFSFDASFNNMMMKDNSADRAFNAGELKLRARSENPGTGRFIYDVGVSGRYGATSGGSDMSEAGFLLDGSVGRKLSAHNGFSAAVHADASKYGGVIDDMGGVVAVTPKYYLSAGIFSLDAGVKLSYPFYSAGDYPAADRVSGQYIYPDIRISLTAPGGKFSFYVKATGGDKFNSYSDVLRSNHHLYPLYGGFLGHDIERINAAAGIRAGDASRFQLDISGGWSSVKNGLFEGLYTHIFDNGGRVTIPIYGYSGYSTVFADMFYAVKSRKVDFNGHLSFRHTTLDANASPVLFKPAMLSGDMLLSYDTGNRVKTGLSCEFASERKALDDSAVPGYADLAVFAEAAVNGHFSVWIKGSNLLGMTIQRVPGFAEKGIWGTAGICLKF